MTLPGQVVLETGSEPYNPYPHYESFTVISTGYNTNCAGRDPPRPGRDEPEEAEGRRRASTRAGLSLNTTPVSHPSVIYMRHPLNLYER